MRWLPLMALLSAGLVTGAAGQARPGPDVDYLIRTGAVFESNLDHDETPEGAYGGVVGMGLRIRSRPDRPVLELEYEVAAHRYSIPAEWNRVSHLGSAALTLRPGRLTFRTAGEVSVKGSSEDRDVGNQYRLEQEVAWRLFRGTTVSMTGVGRLRRYPTDASRDARNGYLEAGLTQRVGGGLRLGAAARVERNVATAARNSYDRATGGVEIQTRGPWGTVELDGSLRIKRYGFRPVEEGDQAGLPREDRRYQIEGEWVVTPWANLDVIMAYQWERRFSNEAGKGYVAHQVGLSLVWRW